VSPKARLRTLALQALVLTVLVGFAVLGALLVCIGHAESAASSWDFGADVDPGRLLFWSVASGAVTLALGVGALRLRLFRSLACLLALGFFVYVVGFSILQTLKEARPTPQLLFHWLPPLLVVIGGAILGCLLEARRAAPARGRAPSIGIASGVCAALFLSALGLSVAGVPGVEPPEKPALQAVTAANVTKIIAQELGVPPERVVPTARLAEDLKAEDLEINEILADLQQEFGTQSQAADGDMLITVQDVLDYTRSPRTFREAHGGQRRSAED
jgi:acyl carrier protein